MTIETQFSEFGELLGPSYEFDPYYELIKYDELSIQEILAGDLIYEGGKTRMDSDECDDFCKRDSISYGID